jgi:tetratricopeptide (TPR) repeat protein
MVVGRRGMELTPNHALGPLVVGPCLEQAGRTNEAIELYTWFTQSYADSPGVPAVRARELLARRNLATQTAREAVARESELTSQQPDPQVVAVLPLAIAGDSVYQPLSRGLAQMIMSDLALIRTFRLVERLQLGALLDELELGQTERVDPATAARVGHLVRAGRMVQGLANIPNEQQVRLEASVVLSSSEVTNPEAVTGRFRDLLQLEKQLVVAIAGGLGYQLSEAERQLVLENGTRNLAAFLAYSRGLEAEEMGNYALAAQHFTEAVRADPNFRDAQVRRETAVAAPQVQQASAGQVTTLAATTVAEPVFFEPTTDALRGVVGDLAPTHTEQTTETVSESVDVAARTSSLTPITDPLPPEVVPPIGITATIRIIFRIP